MCLTAAMPANARGWDIHGLRAVSWSLVGAMPKDPFCHQGKKEPKDKLCCCQRSRLMRISRHIRAVDRVMKRRIQSAGNDIANVLNELVYLLGSDEQVMTHR